MSKRQSNLTAFLQKRSRTDTTETAQVDSEVENLSDLGSGDNEPIPPAEASCFSDLDIGKYVNQRNIDDAKKLKLLQDTWRPDSKFCFPVKLSQSKKDPRKFQYEWLENDKYKKWLCYSAEKSGGFCKYCVLFGSNEINDQQLGALVLSPFSSYLHLKKAHKSLDRHASSQYHGQNYARGESFIEAKMHNVTVLHQLSQKEHEDRIQNNRILKKIIEIIKFLAQQNCALRGDSETGDLTELSNANEGNFRELIRYQVNVCNDEELRKHLQSSGKNAKYLSPEIQNELLGCMADLIRSQIIARVNSSECFSVLADEATDISMRSNLSVSIRFVENATVFEYFLGFVELSYGTGERIAESIVKLLVDSGLNMDYLYAQCYDGAGAMAGCLKGAQARIKCLYPKAIYYHCAAHLLNLALSSMSGIPQIRLAVSLIEKICFYFHQSPKRMQILKDIIDQLPKTLPCDKLKRLCMTRWVEKHKAIDNFRVLFVYVLEALNKIYNCENDMKAKEFAMMIANFEFIFATCLLSEFSDLLLNIATKLQSSNLDLVKCQLEIQKFTNCIIAALDDQKKSDVIFENAGSKMIEADLGAHVAFPAGFTDAKTYYFSQFYQKYLLDLKDQISIRFDSSTLKTFSLQYLIPSYYDNEQRLEKIYNQFVDEFSCSLSQFKFEFSSWMLGLENSRPSNVLDALAVCDKSFRPNVHRALQILATLPVTTVTVERSFSTMRRLKTYLRSSMSESRFTNLALVYTHRAIPFSSDDVLDLFKKKKRRLDL